MPRTKEILNIVDENDNIVGKETRKKIHKEGLLHREVGVWFYNKKGEIIFQLRKMDQETYPGLFDTTVGGHVEIGNSYEESAIIETLEESGINIDKDKLVLASKFRSNNYDQLTGLTNNIFKTLYIYEYNDNINNLVPTEGESFKYWPVDKILNLSDEDKKKFISVFFNKEEQDVIRKIKDLIK